MTPVLHLMTEHPLTDEICDQIQDSVHPCDPENMRTAADWQLEQVNAWIAQNVHNYIDSDNLWTLVYMLKDDLNKTMRPQKDNS